MFMAESSGKGINNCLFHKTSDGRSSDHSGRTIKTLTEPVYYIFSPQDTTVLVGIDVTVQEEQNCYVVSWRDPSHERRMTASKITLNSDYFAFKRIDSEGGQIYFFIPMDLDLYYKRVKGCLIAGRDFDNTEEMIQAFRDEAEWNY